ncbi:hypothetical protein S7711_03484 [Stachybotrys chartarum IBT 7711]|uniref:Uncharacterized protein n=1 Tax=Stachybotrys chartarum (strain CBS 109288 / IBT 7711) TaxID=1280523 RepID=A0A084AFW5_STACB|nr:hypothetical protein S7711_03484 [Stachybotrys chartarum IBT 7711]
MRSLSVFLGLIASASAIDLYLGWTSGSNYILCQRWSPDRCCSTSQSGSPFTSIDFREIPTNWDVSVRVHRGSQCGAVVESQASNGRTNIRIRGGNYGGAGYGFLSRRSENDENVDAETVRPSAVVFADGPRYNLTELDDASFAEMLVSTCLQKFNLYFVLCRLLPPFLYLPLNYIVFANDVFVTSSIEIAASGAESSEVPPVFNAVRIE